MVYGRTPHAADMEDAEQRLTIDPRVVPRPGAESSTGRSFCARITLVASRVTRNVPVVLTSRKR